MNAHLGLKTVMKRACDLCNQGQGKWESSEH